MLLQFSAGWCFAAGLTADCFTGHEQYIAVCTCPVCMLAEVASPGPGARYTLVESEHMPGYMFERVALVQFPVNIRQHAINDSLPGRRRAAVAEQAGIHASQDPGVVVGLAAKHDAVDMLKMGTRFRKRLDPAVDDNFQFGEIRFQPVHAFVSQRRYGPVFLRTQTLQECLAGVHDNRTAAATGQHSDECSEFRVAVVVVDTDTGLDCHRDIDTAGHGGDAGGDGCRLCHQAGTETPGLHPITRAAEVEIDFIVTRLFTDPRSRRQGGRVAATELQGDGVFNRVKAQQVPAVAVQHGMGRHHLGVQQAMAGDLAQEKPAVAIRPFHHGRNAEGVIWLFSHGSAEQYIRMAVRFAAGHRAGCRIAGLAGSRVWR